jgi:hypothetical protein
LHGKSSDELRRHHGIESKDVLRHLGVIVTVLVTGAITNDEDSGLLVKLKIVVGLEFPGFGDTRNKKLQSAIGIGRVS